MKKSIFILGIVFLVLIAFAYAANPYNATYSNAATMLNITCNSTTQNLIFPVSNPNNIPAASSAIYAQCPDISWNNATEFVFNNDTYNLVFGFDTNTTLSKGTAPDNITMYLPFDEKNGGVIDYINALNTTRLGSLGLGITGKIHSAFDFTNSDLDGIKIADNDLLSPPSAMTINLWIKTNMTIDYGRIWSKWEASGSQESYFTHNNNEKLRFILKTTSNTYDLQTNSVGNHSDGNWHMITAVWDGSEMRVYIDAEQDGNTLATAGTLLNTGADLYIGRYSSDTQSFSGHLDDLQFYDINLSDSEISLLYEYGNTMKAYYNTTVTAPPNPYNVTLINITNSVAYFNSSINCSYYAFTNDSSQNFTLNLTNGQEWNATIINWTTINATYYEVNGTYSFSALANTTQYDNFTCTGFISNSTDTLSQLSDVINIKNYVPTVNLLAPANDTVQYSENITFTFTVSDPDYDNATCQVNSGSFLNFISNGTNQSISAIFSPATTVTAYINCSDGLNSTTTDTYTYKFFAFNITANSTNGIIINNFTASILETGFNASTTSGQLYLFAPNSSNFTLFIDAEGFAYQNATNFTTGLKNIFFLLYPTNSIWFNFVDELTGNPVNTSNGDLFYQNFTFIQGYSTTNGTIKVNELLAGDYALEYYATGYTTRTYYFTITNRTFSNVSLYLFNASETVVANVFDTYANELEGVIIKVMKWDSITGTYILVETGRTNFEGQANLALELYTKRYYFILEYGSVTDTTEPAYIYDTTLNFYLQLVDPIAQDFYSLNRVTGYLIYNNATDQFNFYYNDAEATVTEGCLYVYSISSLMQETLLNTSCVSAASGDIYINITPINGTSYKANAFVDFGNSDRLFASLIKDFPLSYPYGDDGLFWFIIIEIVFLFISIWSASVAMLFMSAGFAIGRHMGLITIGLGPMSGIIVLAIIVGVIIDWVRYR